MTLRQKLVRLAYNKPSLRQHLLPLVLGRSLTARPIPLDIPKVDAFLDAFWGQAMDAIEKRPAWGFMHTGFLVGDTFTVQTVKKEVKTLSVEVHLVDEGNIFQGAAYQPQKNRIVIILKTQIAKDMLDRLKKGGPLRSTVRGVLLHELTHAVDVLHTKGYLQPADFVVSMLQSMGVKAAQIQAMYLDKSPKQRDRMQEVLQRFQTVSQENLALLKALPEDMRALAVIDDVPGWQSLSTSLRKVLEDHLRLSLQDKPGAYQLSLHRTLVEDAQNFKVLMQKLTLRYLNQAPEIKAFLQTFIAQAVETYEKEYVNLSSLTKQVQVSYLLSRIPVWREMSTFLDSKSKQYFLKAFYQAFTHNFAKGVQS